jgi:hypothetical protein
MIRAMIWKEYREHRAIWLTLAVVSAGGLLGLTRLMAPGGISDDLAVRQSLQAVAVLLAWTYGLVCGSMLLAVEREGATLTFLDMLPVRRLELWLVKFAIAMVLFMGQLVVLTGIVIGLDITATGLQVAGTLLAMLMFGLFALAWGLLFSSRGDNVLNVIGLAIVGQIAGVFAAMVLLMPLWVVFKLKWPEGDVPLVVLACLGGIGLTVGPIVASARIFSRPDRLRGPAVKTPVRRQPGMSRTASWVRLLWLSYQQMRRLMLGLIVFTLALGFLLPAVGAMAWPALTLFIGMLCGVTVCADEQQNGSFRFLGDQRFPLGRVWVVKVGMRFALAVFTAFLLLLPSIILTILHRAGTPPLGEQRRGPFFSEALRSYLVGPVIPTALHLSMWLMYGFSVGHLGGLLFRKSLVAGAVSLGGAALLVSLWVPSLVGIGLHFWQVAGVPVILLATARILVPAWAADRLVARRTFLRVGGGLVAAGLWTAGGLWYRMAEVPNLPDEFDMPAFEASIPPPDEDKNPAGLRIRAAWTQVSRVTQALQEKQPGQPPVSNQLEDVVQRGWPWRNQPSELGDWLEEVFAKKENAKDDWLDQLSEAAGKPLGVVEDARLLNIAMLDNTNKWISAHSFSYVLAVRGLQQQANGNPNVFVDNLRIGLSLSRNLQNRTPSRVARAGRSMEGVWFVALDRWLERLSGEPGVCAVPLKRVLDILTHHEAELPDESDPVKAEYLIARNSLDQVPEQFLEAESGRHAGEDISLRRAEIEAAALLWRIPWERERHQRIVRVAFQGSPQQRLQAARWGGLTLSTPPLLNIHALPRGKRGTTWLRASQLKVALRLYRAETGQPAEELAVLVPRYLPSIPLDPFDGRPFRYRLSHGENIGWPPDPPANAPGGMAGGMPAGVPGGAVEQPPTRFVPKGQGILWSVGEDGRDEGGKRQSTAGSAAQVGEDIIFLVPQSLRNIRLRGGG